MTTGKVIPIKVLPGASAAQGQRRQAWRGRLQALFFIAFVLVPLFDVFRLDLTLHHFIFFGMPWGFGIDDFQAGQISSTQLAANIVIRGFLPIVAIVGGVVWVSWKYGRLYCGWLCPHFSVVEVINQLMWRATGKPSVWEKHPIAHANARVQVRPPNVWWWIPTLLAVVGFAALWAVVALTYLLPPIEVYSNLLQGTPTRNQALFIGVGTLLLSIEFLLARHLFCRFACAAGLFQSLAWMGNRKAMVVGYQRPRARECATCDAACEQACPMRLPPRSVKRQMFACVQCGQCLSACETVQNDNPQGTLLGWVHSDEASHEAAFSARVARGEQLRDGEGEKG